MAERERWPFSTSEYGKRLERVQKSMVQRDIEVLLLNVPENIFYLTGYQTVGYYVFQVLVVPAQGAPFMVVRDLEVGNVHGAPIGTEAHTFLDHEVPVETLVAALSEAGWARSRIGVEKDAWFLTINEYAQLQRLLPQAQFRDGSGIVEQCRLIKSPQEIAVIRRAARACEAGMAAAIEVVTVGSTEDDVAIAMFAGSVAGGSEAPSILPFVASGPRATQTHATWSGRELQEGDAVWLENSGCVARYSAALVRSVALGSVPQEYLRMGEVCIESLQQSIDFIKPGVTSSEVDHVCRRPFEQAGYGDLYRHRSGYSIGISFPPDWGEGHILSLRQGEPAVLQAGMTFHLLTHLMVHATVAVGCTQTLLVTEGGCERVTQFDERIFVK